MFTRPQRFTHCVLYTASGGDQPFTVPAGVTTLDAQVKGAGGGAGTFDGVPGGAGGQATGTIAVTGGQTLAVSVGQVGGYGRGGTSGGGSRGSGGAGGGLSALWTGAAFGPAPLLVAGGGGGGAGAAGGAGGAGGGASGSAGGGGAQTGTGGGGGATSAAGGVGGAGCGATGGSQYQGGSGGGGGADGGGGGGGGYFGGGGGICQPAEVGANADAAGGGGSGFVGAGVTGGALIIGGGGAPGTAGTVRLQWTALIDLTVTKTADRADYTPGEPLTYTVEVANAGPAPATSVPVTDTLAAPLSAFTWTCVATSGSCGGASGTGNINTTVDLDAGGSATFTITGTIASNAHAVALDPMDNTFTATKPAATVDANCGPSCSATSSLPLHVVTTPKVEKTVSRSQYVQGQPLTYTLEVTNGGPSDALGLAVKDPVPAALSGFAWTCAPAAASVCAAASGTGSIDTTADVVAGGSVTYTMTGTVPEGTVDPLANTGSVENPDCPAGSCVSSLIVPIANPLIIKKLSNPSPKPGEKVTYTVTVQNVGTDDIPVRSSPTTCLASSTTRRTTTTSRPPSAPRRSLHPSSTGRATSRWAPRPLSRTRSRCTLRATANSPTWSSACRGPTAPTRGPSRPATPSVVEYLVRCSCPTPAAPRRWWRLSA